MQPPQNSYNQPPLASPTGGAPYGGPNYTGQNDSGTGATAVLPLELRGLNWGGFLLTFFWAIAHSTWIGLLCLVPYIGWIMGFIVLFKGNEWAWQNRRWDSVDQFREVQKKWTTWGIIILVAGIVLGILGGILIGIAASHTPPPSTTMSPTSP